jgi:hypothetical protein
MEEMKAECTDGEFFKELIATSEYYANKILEGDERFIYDVPERNKKFEQSYEELPSTV